MAGGVDILPGQQAAQGTVRGSSSQPAQNFGPEPLDYGEKGPATGLGPGYGTGPYLSVSGNNALYNAIRSHEEQINPGRAPRFAGDPRLTVSPRGSSGGGL